MRPQDLVPEHSPLRVRRSVLIAAKPEAVTHAGFEAGWGMTQLVALKSLIESNPRE